MITNSSITTPSYNKIAFGAGGQQIAKAVKQELKKEAQELVYDTYGKGMVKFGRGFSIFAQLTPLIDVATSIITKVPTVMMSFGVIPGMVSGTGLTRIAKIQAEKFAEILKEQGRSAEEIAYGASQVLKQGGDIIGSHPIFHKKFIQNLSK